MALVRNSIRLTKRCLQTPLPSQALRIATNGFTSKGPSSTSSAPKATGKKGSEIKSEDKSTTRDTAGQTYKAMEYYNHTEWSYYDLESDMRKHRLAQPSAK